jgi:valyl-tRNA synthetase
MSEAAGPDYAGLMVEHAQAKIVSALEAEGRIRDTESYTHEVPYSHRSGQRIEPLISLQWFMRMDELAAPAIEAVRSGRVNIHPASQSRRYLHWLQEIRPWCISRQLWWGHQLPVWYRGTPPTHETYVGEQPPEGEGWERDPDVLDTWFSSALWPFATLGWPQQTPELKAFYPTDVLLTARDILFLWVARMVMMGTEFAGDIPFEHVYVHSVIQAPDGRRMSKSLGTGIDPMDLIEGGGGYPAYGADAVRFGLLAMSSSQDVRFSEEKVAQGRALAQKLYSAARLILMNVERGEADPRPQTLEDRWIVSRLQRAVAHAHAAIEGFEFHQLSLGLYDFVYGELCDWYLELFKGREVNADLGATALYVLRETLALSHPVIPFVTEELWSHVPGAEGLLAGGRLPQPDESLIDEQAEAEFGRVMDAVSAIRAWRDGADVKPGFWLPAALPSELASEQVARLARLDLDGARDGEHAIVLTHAGPVEIWGGVDPAEEARKREAKRTELESEIARAESKLANEGFTAKAPEAVVQAERDKLERLRAELEAL